MYLKKNQDLSNDLAYRSWKQLRDQNIIKTDKEKLNIESTQSDVQFIKLSEDNPITKATGVQYWYDKSYEHYFEGTSGVDIRGASKRLAGNTEAAKMIEAGAITAYKLMQVVKGLILVARPQSYINSFISSMTIYATHAMGFDAIKDFRAATSTTNKFTTDLNKYVDLYTKAGESNQKAAKAYWDANLENSPMMEMMRTGIISTIRGDLYRMSNTKQFNGHSALKKVTDRQTADGLKALIIDPSEPLGNQLAQLFDMMELKPKMMLYLNKRRTMSAQEASTSVLMAFPTYYNLPGWAAPLDMISPYTKFLSNAPRNILYGVNQSPLRMTSGFVLAHSMVPLSYAFTEDAKYDYYKDNGYIKMPGVDYGYFSHSLFPIWKNPLDNPYTDGFSPTFLPEAMSSLSKPGAYIPGTRMTDD